LQRELADANLVVKALLLFLEKPEPVFRPTPRLAQKCVRHVP